ncbi:diguanylate cyclase [Escherichia coli]|nr:diguanylate cyclase [Escherichia coli]
MHLWYLSRMAEMFSKLIVVSVFIYHIFKVLKSTKQLSNLDPMTKIYNRNFFFEKINELLSTGDTYSSGVFIIDIDHFKSVNDTWGHPAGDRVILAVVDILKQGIRTTDILSRLGGEEFGIIINNMDPSKIKILAERLRRHVETQTNNTTLYNIPGGVTISIGVTLIRDKSLNASDIYNATDNALYKAKSSGRNKVVFSEMA